MAKVSELLEQARALEAQGEHAKALAIYEHLLPHLEGMPAIKADIAIKSGDLMLKLGNPTGALGMYDTAGTQCAVHGSTKGVLTVASKIQRAAPQRTDVYLLLAGQMVKHGHAGPAVDVLIQHAKLANLPNMLQELEPLAGRSSEDVRPLVEMLLDAPATPAPPPPVASAPPPPPPPPPSPPPAPPQLAFEKAQAESLRPMSLEDEMAANAPPMPMAPPPPLSATAGPPSPPKFWPEPAAPPPSFAGPPPPPPPPLTEGLVLELSPPLPPSPRETKEINLRASQVMHREDVEDLERPRARHSRPRVSTPVAAPVVLPAAPPRAPSAARAFALVLALVFVAGAVLDYYGVLPLGDWVDQAKSLIPKGVAKDRDSVAVRPPARASAPPASPNPAPARTKDTPAPSPAAAARAPGGKAPPVRIEGLPVDNFTESGDRFRVTQRSASGQLLMLQGRPLADTVGEPAVGEIRLDSLPGDTSVATTTFNGYVITVRGVISPADLQSLFLQLVSR